MEELGKHVIKIKKASQHIEIDTTAEDAEGNPIFSDAVIHHLLQLGLEVALNARMSGDKVGAVTKMSGKELAEAQKAAMKIANDNLNDLKAGNIKHTRGSSKTTIPTAVRAEAMRLAKIDIKEAVRAAHISPSSYSEKAYTAKAKEYIENDPWYLDKARENIEARKTPSHPITLDLADLGPKVIKKTSKPKKDELPSDLPAKATVKPTHKPTAQHPAH